jgi:hypothetical protein
MLNYLPSLSPSPKPKNKKKNKKNVKSIDYKILIIHILGCLIKKLYPLVNQEIKKK